MTTDNADIKIALSKPITTHSGLVSELSLKPPTLRTMKKAGGSFVQSYASTDDEGRMTIRTEFDAIKLGATIAELSGFDDISLDDLAAADATKIARALVPYFAG